MYIWSVKFLKNIECSELFEICTDIVFLFLFFGIFCALYRIYDRFSKASAKYILTGSTCLAVNATLLGLHMYSDCDRGYIVSGSLLFGIYFCYTMVEICTFMIRVS